jgi:hypothetical protein
VGQQYGQLLPLHVCPLGQHVGFMSPDAVGQDTGAAAGQSAPDKARAHPPW